MTIDTNTTQDDLVEYARVEGGHNDDGRLPRDRIHWTYVEDFDISRLLEIKSEAEWQAWFEEELDIKEEVYGSSEEWSCLLEEDIVDPIVILEHDGLVIWDGWHRSAAAVIRGKPISAVYGIDKRYVLEAQPTASLPAP